MSAAAALSRLERLRLAFGGDAAAQRLMLLRRLAHARLSSAREVRRLHEALCFARAYPDDEAVRAQAEAMLARFAHRADLRAHRAALADSGIAGTAIHYRFFHAQAEWLASRWPQRLRLDRSDGEAEARIAKALPLLVTPVEAQALVEARLPGYAALDRLRGREPDAVFWLRRIAAMPGDGFTREAFSDAVDASFVLEPGPDTPSRSAAHFMAAPVSFSCPGPARGRPDLRAELDCAPRALRRLSRREGEALAELACAAMATRERALAAFSYAHPRDAWLVDDGEGLAYAFIGVRPERRHPLAAIYGGLTLRNQVPIGYVQADIVGATAAVAFNTFDSFRGGEAAWTFARLLSAIRLAFGCTSFTLEPYQLGRDNDEGIDSGAWWFYRKLGFAPRDAGTRALERQERARLARRPSHRSSAGVLRRLAEHHLFFDLDPRRPHPLPPLAALGLQAGAALATRAGGDRERAVAEASAELMRCCGLASLAGFSRDERRAWQQLAPLVVRFDLDRWREDERRALVDLIRAKGATGERDFVARHRAHGRFDAALYRRLGRE